MKMFAVILLFAMWSCDKPKTVAVDLENKSLKTIPDSILNNTELEFLDLNNAMTVYPPGGALMDSGANHITELPEKIGFLTNLKALLLAGNQIKELPKSFINLKNLQTLDLSYDTGFDIIAALGELKKLPSLIQLSIARVKLDMADTGFVKKALSPRTKIIFFSGEYAQTPQQ